jgi:hypothetical protein
LIQKDTLAKKIKEKSADKALEVVQSIIPEKFHEDLNAFLSNDTLIQEY